MTIDTPTVPGALALPRLTRTEAQARTALAQRAQGCAFDWDGQPWQLNLRPLPEPGPVQVDADEWHVAAQWAGAPFELALPASAAQAWVSAQLASNDVPALADEFVAAALEAATGEVLVALEALQRGPAQIDAIGREPGTMLSLPHVFAFEAHTQGQGQVVRGRLATGSLGLMLMAGLVARLPPVRGALPGAELPVLLRAEVGWTWLTPTERSELAVGGAVLVEHPAATPEGDIWLGCGDWGIRARCTDTGVAVTQAFTKLELTMPPNSPSATADTPIPTDQLPMRLAFDLGERTMAFGELQALQPGQVLDLGRPLSGAVNLRVNGALVGTGELVEIDGRLGVAITSLAAQ